MDRIRKIICLRFIKIILRKKIKATIVIIKTIIVETIELNIILKGFV